MSWDALTTMEPLIFLLLGAAAATAAAWPLVVRLHAKVRRLEMRSSVAALEFRELIAADREFDEAHGAFFHQEGWNKASVDRLLAAVKRRHAALAKFVEL